MGFGIYGVWRYQAWLPLVTNKTAVSVSNPDKAPIDLAPKETIAAFKALLPETAQKRKVVLEFHATMPEENNSYAFMKDSTWGENGVGVACGKFQNLDEGGLIKKVEVFVTPEKLVEQLGRDEAFNQINDVVRACFIQALSGGNSNQESYRSQFKEAYKKGGAIPLIEWWGLTSR